MQTSQITDLQQSQTATDTSEIDDRRHNNNRLYSTPDTPQAGVQGAQTVGRNM